MDREEFMTFFRRDDFHELITPSDAEEIFLSVLHGSSDITIPLLNDLLNEYGVISIKLEEVKE